MAAGGLDPEPRRPETQKGNRTRSDRWGIPSSGSSPLGTWAATWLRVTSRPAFHGSVAAADLSPSEADLEQIDRIVADFVPLSGPSPETMPD